MSRIKEYFHEEINKGFDNVDDEYAFQQWLNTQNQSKQKLSNCCNKPFIKESDICSECKEHATPIE